MLVKIGDSTYADMSMPADEIEQASERHGFTFIPAHVFVRLDREGDTVSIRLLDDDWLKQGLKDGTLTLGHTVLDGTPVLTAPTAELQAFFKAHADKAWKPAEDGGKFKRAVAAK